MFPVGTPVTISKDCDLWGGFSGVVHGHRPAPSNVDDFSYIGVIVDTDHGKDSSWFAESELEIDVASAFLMVGLLVSVNELVAAEKGCDHMDEANLKWVEFIAHDGTGEDHQVCKRCDKVVCCPDVDGKYPRAVR